MAEHELGSEKPDSGPTILLSPEAEARYERITRNLAEMTSLEIMRKQLSEGGVLKGYWGTAITGRPHIAYCVPLLKIADFLAADVELHGFLDANKSTEEELKWRTKYYAILLTWLFIVLGVPVDRFKFVAGTSYQLDRKYNRDMYKFHKLTTAKACEHAGADVVKQSDSPSLTNLLYPGLQALDEEYLGVHFQFGGVDQRKIFMYAAQHLPRLGYAKRAHLMNPMVPGLSGGKMSSSEPKSKIDFLDKPAEVKTKLKAAVCTPGQVEGNGVLAFLKSVLIPVQRLWEEQAKARSEDGTQAGQMTFGKQGEVGRPVFKISRPEDYGGDFDVEIPVKLFEEQQAKARSGEMTFVKRGAPEGTIFSISRPEKFGGDIHYPDYEAVEEAYGREELHPGDLKAGVTDALNLLLAPIQKAFDADTEWQEAEKYGYPDSSVSTVVASARQGAGIKVDGKTKPAKEIRNHPPTEEERAALRLRKEQEKLAKTLAKNASDNLSPIEVQKGDHHATAPGPDGRGSKSVIDNTYMPRIKMLSKGKVRDLYALPDEQDSDKLLFVTTDRISAFDVNLENGIPQKGITLTMLSLFWFHKLSHIIPNHVLIPSLVSPPSSRPVCLTSPASTWSEFPPALGEYRDQLEGRSMIVRKCEVVKIEAIVRGYITGSAWTEYEQSQTVHGISMSKGLVESQKLSEPIFTPSTKAEQGEHDRNIHPDEDYDDAVKGICGPILAAEIERVALRLYTEAAEYCLDRGLILADTKFEFGLAPNSTGDTHLVLIDELLTPDSSRYWSAAAYVPGRPQASFDKQYLRDWLIHAGLRNKEGVTLPDEVVRETRRKYEEAADLLMGTGESVIDGRKSSGSGDERKILSDRSTGVMQDQPKSGESEVHGKKGLIADETGLQTDQVADAIEDETGKLF